MVHQSVIQARINQLGVKISHWYKPELKELALLLMDDEQIVALVTGRYYGGYAMLVATNSRLLLIDKKTMFMSLEDVRYDMISEIGYSSRLFDATITIFTVNKQHKFTSVKHKDQMRHLTAFAQKRIMEIRQPQNSQQPSHITNDSSKNLQSYNGYQPVQQRAEFGSKDRHWTVHTTSGTGVTQHLRSVGTAAIRGAHLSAINPHSNSSLIVKRNWLGNSSSISTNVEPAIYR